MCAQISQSPLKRKRQFDLGARVLVMGVVNVTPDSFSDGGDFFSTEKAVGRAMELAREGADIIDIGGESTRPGAVEVGVEEELCRVIPVIEELAQKTDTILSIDTRKSRVAREAIRAGATIVNDVSALHHDPAIAGVAAEASAKLILMHMRGTPRDMQKDTVYTDLMNEIIGYLKGSIAQAQQAGVARDNIIIDPGIGFGKTVDHNLTILHRLRELTALGYPVCVGTSRKSFIGKVLNVSNPKDRLLGTIVTTALAVWAGARMVRVHDVKEAVAAVRMAESVLQERIPASLCR